MLKDKDYKDMLTQWCTASDSDWLALADAHDMEEPIQPKVDKQFPKQKRQRLAATHPAKYGDMADALAGIVSIADQSDAPPLLSLENLAPAVEDAADSCDTPALLALEGSPTAVDDPETQPPSHTPVPAAQDHMAHADFSLEPHTAKISNMPHPNTPNYHRQPPSPPVTAQTYLCLR